MVLLDSLDLKKNKKSCGLSGHKGHYGGETQDGRQSVKGST
jgi:hypothetical protein